MSKARVAESHIQSVRSFNRFYTRQIGLLNEGVYHSPFSLTDVRVLYELAHRSRPAAAELVKELGLDAGYLSRILSRFPKLGLISRTASKSDGRRSLLSLTARGRKVFASLDSRSSNEVATVLRQLAEADQERLTYAMHQIQYLLGSPAAGRGPYLLRSHRPADLDSVVH